MPANYSRARRLHTPRGESLSDLAQSVSTRAKRRFTRWDRAVGLKCYVHQNHLAGLITPRLLYPLLRVSDSAGLEGVAQEFAFLTGSQGLLMLILDHALGTTVIEDTVANGGKGPGGLGGELSGGRCRALGVSGKDFVSTAYFLCVLSVPIPFRGDYIGLQGNPKLQKLKSNEEGPILVAETVQKFNRGNGKVKACFLNSPRPDPEPRLLAGRVGLDPAFPHPFLFCP